MLIMVLCLVKLVKVKHFQSQTIDCQEFWRIPHVEIEDH
ncbi:hypothetical protein GLYMA_18G139950v4 [Glycine max]|nr:hypothetical protein GLYMA_18G139950v4 [Glycine max]KAH1154460.1 hypothetical protein GYH30_049942 [Glycine max]